MLTKLKAPSSARLAEGKASGSTGHLLLPGEGRQCADRVQVTKGATRIDRRFAALKKEGRPGLVTFITAGDPDYATSKEILLGLPAAGADLIELGMPFSDPMADGPAVQASSLRALRAGHKMHHTLELVTDFRQRDPDTPIILMVAITTPSTSTPANASSTTRWRPASTA